MILRACQFEYHFPCRALVMGILNLTPDSFSDGGLYLDPAKAVQHAFELVEQGADLLDLGGESTRPRAQPVSEAEELRRVMPVLEALAHRVRIPLAIDTMKPAVARAALEAGASLINDVAANRTDETMWRVAAQTGAGYVCVHMQGTPLTMQLNPVYHDVVAQVGEFFADRLRRLATVGVRPEQVILDVGIGFGKTLEHNLQLLAGLNRFTKFERPSLLGVSRKSFLAQWSGTEAAGRLPGGLACAVWAIQQGVQIVRTHDVAATVQALRVAEAVLARRTS